MKINISSYRVINNESWKAIIPDQRHRTRGSSPKWRDYEDWCRWGWLPACSPCGPSCSPTPSWRPQAWKVQEEVELDTIAVQSCIEIEDVSAGGSPHCPWRMSRPRPQPQCSLPSAASSDQNICCLWPQNTKINSSWNTFNINWVQAKKLCWRFIN